MIIIDTYVPVIQFSDGSIGLGSRYVVNMLL